VEQEENKDGLRQSISSSGIAVTRHAKQGEQRPLSTRSKLDYALQFDQNHNAEPSNVDDDKDLELDDDEYAMLQALNSFVAIPSMTLGICRPVKKGSLEVDEDAGLPGK
jgi:hypothetical protein